MKPKPNSRYIRQAISEIEKLDFTGELSFNFEPIQKKLFTGYLVEAPISNEPIDVYRARKCKKPIYLSEMGPPQKKS